MTIPEFVKYAIVVVAFAVMLSTWLAILVSAAAGSVFNAYFAARIKFIDTLGDEYEYNRSKTKNLGVN